MTCAQAVPPRRMLRGLRAYKGVDAHIQGFACEQHTAIDTESAKVQTHCLKMTDFRLLLPNGSALWRPHHLTPRPHRHQTGGNRTIRRVTRRRHADSQPLMLQNSHRRHRGHRRDRRAWPDNVPTRRAKLSVRTARGPPPGTPRSPAPRPGPAPGTSAGPQATTSATQQHVVSYNP